MSNIKYWILEGEENVGTNRQLAISKCNGHFHFCNCIIANIKKIL